MQLEVVFDTVCPWCFIGKRRLEQALAERPRLKATPRWHAFLLNPEMPPEGIDRSAYLVKKFGSEARVRRIYGAIAEAGHSVEIEFAFDRIRRTPNSINSHRLIRFADRAGRAEETVEALFRAFFVAARDIGEIEVLLEVGHELGLGGPELESYLASDQDVAAIYEENARAHRLGINGVPSYVFNNRMIISGAQEAQVIARMLDAALETEAAA